jgi:hypothetical protein
MAAWLFAVWKRPGAEVSIVLLGYTNKVAGIPMFDYATNNVAHSGFALLSAHNATRSHFAVCFPGAILVHHADSGNSEVILLMKGRYSVQTNRPPSVGEVFDLAPGATVTFSVPAPDGHGTWKCLINMIHVYNYKHHWQNEAVVFAERLGFHFGDQGLSVWSREIVQ